MTIGFCPLVFIILLMIVLCLPESGCRLQHGCHYVSFTGQNMNILFGNPFFCCTAVKNAGEVLGTDVRTLAVGLREIVRFKEQFHHLLVGCYYRVENHLSGLQMACILLAHLLVGGVLHMPPHKTHAGLFHPRGFHKEVFRTPETAGRKIDFAHTFLSGGNKLKRDGVDAVAGLF